MVTREGRFCGQKGEVVWDDSHNDTHYEVLLDTIYMPGGTPLSLKIFFAKTELSRERWSIK